MVRHANKRQMKRADFRHQRDREEFLECQRAVERLYLLHCVVRIQRALRRARTHESGFVVV